MSKFKETFNLTQWPHQPSSFNHSQAVVAVILGIIYEQVWELMFLSPAGQHQRATSLTMLILLTAVQLFIASNLLRQINNLRDNLPTKHDYFTLPIYVAATLCTGLVWAIICQPLLAIHQVHVAGNQATLDTYTKLPYGISFLVIATLLLAPIIEEFIFRATIIGNPQTKAQAIKRTTFSIVLFALLHMINQLLTIHTGADLRMAIFNFGQYAIIASGMSYIYLKYRSYRYNVAFHALWNLLTLCFMINWLVTSNLPTIVKGHLHHAENWN